MCLRWHSVFFLGSWRTVLPHTPLILGRPILSNEGHSLIRQEVHFDAYGVWYLGYETWRILCGEWTKECEDGLDLYLTIL